VGAVRRGADVLDDQRPAARTVGDTLGAVDLDRWSVALESATPVALLERVNAYLLSRGERWEVLAAERTGEAIESLDLGALRVPGRALRVVLIDRADPCLVRATEQLEGQPATALLLVLDHVLERMNATPDRRARLLAAPARAAIREVPG
jgi:hypothetical protein